MEYFTEIEAKYRADDIKLTDFIKLAENMKYTKKLEVSSFDYYYTKSEDEFLRYRDSQTPELTIKKKVVDKNNFNRVEIDLPLSKDKITKGIVDKFASSLGYNHNFTIYKTCFIYFLDICNIVWYAVYDPNMKEIGRYIELEVNKDKVPELGEAAAFQKIADLEKELADLGITHKNRMKKSLFELYRK